MLPNFNQLMLYRAIIAVYSEIHTKHINSLRGQNGEFFLRWAEREADVS
jgi:hypothetical protein